MACCTCSQIDLLRSSLIRYVVFCASGSLFYAQWLHSVFNSICLQGSPRSIRRVIDVISREVEFAGCEPLQ